MRLPRRTLLTARLRLRRALARAVSGRADRPAPWHLAEPVPPEPRRLGPRHPTARGLRSDLRYPDHLRSVRLRHRDRPRTLGVDLLERCRSSPPQPRRTRPRTDRGGRQHVVHRAVPREHVLEPARLYALVAALGGERPTASLDAEAWLESADALVARMHRQDRRRRAVQRAWRSAVAMAVLAFTIWVAPL